MFKVGFRIVDGNQRGVVNRQKLLCWQVVGLLKNDGYFYLEFTEKRLHNQIITYLKGYASGYILQKLTIYVLKEITKYAVIKPIIAISQ